MRLKHGFIFVALMLGVILLPPRQARSQDTLVVQWSNPDGSLKINALYDAFVGDTINRPAGRVYKLLRGGYYANTEHIDNTGRPLRIVGVPGDPSDPYGNPPVLQMYRRADNSVDQRMITVMSDLVLKNLWITGADDIGTQTAYQPIQVDGSNITVVIDNCIFDRSNFAIVAFQNGKNNKIYITNNKYRNLIERPVTQQWTGRAVSVWADQDTVVFENNTLFNVACFVFQMEGGAIKYLRFNHNTIVNLGRGFAGNWWRDGYFTNNLWINPFFDGEGRADYTASGRDPRSYTSGIWNIGPLPAMYGPEEGRRIVFANNTAWRDPRFTTYYGDTIRAQGFIGDVTRLDFLAGTPYPNMVVRDTVWLSDRPNLVTYPDTLVPRMWESINALRRGISPIPEWFFHLPQYGGAECYTCVDWPPPENFSYTTPANLLTAGTDHLPLGDLNWFPTQKATFEANKATYVKQIEDMAGPVIIYQVDSTAEAEFGGLGGTAAVDKFTGFSYFDMASGGFIQWDFDLAAGGVYGMNVWSNLRSQGMRGEHFYINGKEIHDVIGWGELEFRSSLHSQDWMPARGVGIGLPDDRWQWYFYPKDSILAADQPNFIFVAGRNTIKITPSWGYQDFAGIDLIKEGVTPPLGQTVTGPDLVIALRAPDATSAVVTPRGEGAPWVPSLFKSVKMGTAGTDTLTFTASSTGNYRVRIFGQNYNSSPQLVTIKEGATTLGTASLPRVKPDTTGLDAMSSAFQLTTGSHKIVLSAADVYIDYVQLIKETISSVSQTSNLPQGFALAQNYPNPFNPTTTIDFSVGKASNVKLIVYNILGQKVATLVDSRMDAGTYTVQFDARNFASGVYLYRLQAGDFRSDKKMLLLK